MDNQYWIFAAFLLLWGGKWIMLFFLAPLIRIKNSRLTYLRDVGKLQEKKNRSNPMTTYKSQRVLAIVTYFLGYVRYMDIQVGQIPSHHIRNFIYKNIFRAKLAPKSVIYYGAQIRKHNQLSIGEGSVIGDHAILDARNFIEIGNNVVLASNVSIWTEQHDHKDPFFRCNSDSSFRVRIDDRVWIGPNVIILHGVHIGEGAVIGAGAVVTKDIPAFTIATGIPAKVIGMRNKEIGYKLDGSYSPFY